MSRAAKWLILTPCLLIFLYTVFGFFAFHMNFPILRPGPMRGPVKYYDYAGITHVHSRLSTGSGTLKEIIIAAAKASNEFLIFTDLNVTARPEAVEGYRENVLVIWAGEYSYLGGHLLAYDLPQPLPYSGAGQAQMYFADLLSQTTSEKSKTQTLLIAAHPFLPQQNFERLDLPGLGGLEVINLNSLWSDAARNSKPSVFWSFLMLPFNTELAYLRLFRPPIQEISTWDSELEKRHFVGMSGADATARAIPWLGSAFDFPRYEAALALSKNHLLLKSELTGDYFRDREKVLEALETGSFYFSLDVLGNPKGFYFEANIGKRAYPMGSDIQTSQPVTLLAELPEIKGIPFEIALFRNGRKILAVNEPKLSYLTNEPGVYRVVVQVVSSLPLPDGKRWFPWIYSNAIRVTRAK